MLSFRKNLCGFTLVETATVVVIISIIAGVSLHYLTGYAKYAVQSRLEESAVLLNAASTPYCAERLLPAGTPVSSQNDPRSAAEEAFLSLRDMVPNLRVYSSLSDYEANIASRVNLTQNTYQLQYAKKDDSGYKFFLVDTEQINNE